MKIAHLPSRSESFDMILKLEAPFQSIAWLMVETGLKFSDLQGLRVRDIQLERGRMMAAGQAFQLSAGLIECVRDYTRDILRPAFEQLKRQESGKMFTEIRLFPLWMLDGCEDAAVDDVLTVTEFVAALQVAGEQSGYRGVVNSNTFRLVAAREWIAQGMSMNELNVRLGHRDLMTTMLLAQTLRHGGLTFAAAA